MAKQEKEKKEKKEEKKKPGFLLNLVKKSLQTTKKSNSSIDQKYKEIQKNIPKQKKIPEPTSNTKLSLPKKIPTISQRIQALQNVPFLPADPGFGRIIQASARNSPTRRRSINKSRIRSLGRGISTLRR